MQRRPSSPFQIHVSPELARPWLPDSTVDSPKMSPFANHLIDIMMGNAARTMEEDADGSDLIWMVIQNPDRFTFEDIKNLLLLAETYGLRAYVWHWPSFTITDQHEEGATVLGDKFLAPLKQDDGDFLNGAQLVEYEKSGGIVLSRMEAEAKRAEIHNNASV